MQIRTYHFQDTDEDIPYAVFVSSKASPGKKNPLVVALHGLGGDHTSLMRGNAIDLAEEGGYILVGPMGYNSRGWYGVPAGNPPQGSRNRSTGPQGRSRPDGQDDPPNLRELSEKDVLNVLGLIREEFNVDERRTYLMGHSMGGAGTFHLGVKYPDNWAAIAVIAPAAFALEPASIAKIPDMPVAIVHGDMDTAVPVSLSRSWVEVLEENHMTHAYLEIPGGDHGSAIPQGMPSIFAFFGSHARPASR